MSGCGREGSKKKTASDTEMIFSVSEAVTVNDTVYFFGVTDLLEGLGYADSMIPPEFGPGLVIFALMLSPCL